MRQIWTLLPILHANRTPPFISSINISAKYNGISKFPIITTLSPTTIHFLIQHPHMASLYNSFPSKNTSVRTTPLTTQSTRRSPYRRFDSPCSCTTKTWRLRHTTNYINA
uniref:Uncharacterized protein n=1 Tax=Monodon monoceros TaxID=40151 RepID=A0A8C6BTG4_MONMO